MTEPQPIEVEVVAAGPTGAYVNVKLPDDQIVRVAVYRNGNMPTWHFAGRIDATERTLFECDLERQLP